jgi:hypothetical protein
LFPQSRGNRGRLEIQISRRVHGVDPRCGLAKQNTADHGVRGGDLKLNGMTEPVRVAIEHLQFLKTTVSPSFTHGQSQQLAPTLVALRTLPGRHPTSSPFLSEIAIRTRIVPSPLPRLRSAAIRVDTTSASLSVRCVSSVKMLRTALEATASPLPHLSGQSCMDEYPPSPMYAVTSQAWWSKQNDGQMRARGQVDNGRGSHNCYKLFP